nr:reverse transcriptase domain-containing protein [Tanacetum cinerariifolium]
MPDFGGNSLGYAVGGSSRGAGFDDEDMDERLHETRTCVDISGGYHIHVWRELDSHIQNHVQRSHRKLVEDDGKCVREAINNLIAQRVTEALAEYETQRNNVVNGYTSHTTRTGPRTVRPTRECTYKDYLNSLLYERRFLEESDEIERYVSRLPEMIQGNVMSYEPKSMQKAIEAANGNAVARAYRVGTAGGNPYANVVTGTFLLNNHYALILFDTGADKSFVLNYSYDVELADGQIIEVNTIIRGCTLNFLNHPFNIDLMPVELNSFNVIIGMDWLKTYHAVIVCDEKIIQIKQRLQTARDRQKSYANVRHRPLEFQVLEMVRTIAYRLELPQQLSRVHSTFYISNLKKCLSDEPLAIPLDELHIDDKLRFVEEPVEIIDR